MKWMARLIGLFVALTILFPCLVDEALAVSCGHLHYDEARILDGDKPVDARAFSGRLARLIARGLSSG